MLCPVCCRAAAVPCPRCSLATPPFLPCSSFPSLLSPLPALPRHLPSCPSPTLLAPVLLPTRSRPRVLPCPPACCSLPSPSARTSPARATPRLPAAPPIPPFAPPSFMRPCPMRPCALACFPSPSLSRPLLSFRHVATVPRILRARAPSLCSSTCPPLPVLPSFSMRPSFMRSCALACFLFLLRSLPPLPCDPLVRVPLTSRARPFFPCLSACPPRLALAPFFMRPSPMRPFPSHLLLLAAAPPVPIDRCCRSAPCPRARSFLRWCCSCAVLWCSCTCSMRPCFMRLSASCVLIVSLRMSAVPPGLSAGPCPSLRPFCSPRCPRFPTLSRVPVVSGSVPVATFSASIIVVTQDNKSETVLVLGGKR